MALGGVIGYFLRQKNFIKFVPSVLHLIVFTLLFLLGITVGSNQLIMENLFSYCGQAAVISLLGVTGSIAASMIIYRFFFKTKRHHEE